MNIKAYIDQKLAPYEQDFQHLENYIIRSVDDVLRLSKIKGRIRGQVIILDTFLEPIDTEELAYWMEISIETDITVLTQNVGDHALFRFGM